MLSSLYIKAVSLTNSFMMIILNVLDVLYYMELWNITYDMGGLNRKIEQCH
jgi:hypothetical protein